MKALQRTPAGRRRTVAAVLAATVVLGGAGAVSAVAFTGDDRDSTRAAAGTTAGTHDDRVDHGRTGGHDDSGGGAVAPGVGVGLKQAADAATRSVAGTVTEVEPAGWWGKAVWEVDVVDAKGTEHEVTVNATDGKATVGRADRDEDGDDHGDAALAKSARIGPGQAVDTALGEVPGSATSAELGHDHGRRAVWRIDVTDDQGAEHEVTVDAHTGEVTATRSDGDADDDREVD
ncbi:PepSY domain-containing protein [Streptomyces kebangsaanensis]|uniref:PepSY domain-containing protein n=1 Tax=Streptomyces kebangsaanensis TaxID=864058 RepID=A0ABW6KYL4_9ACTN